MNSSRDTHTHIYIYFYIWCYIQHDNIDEHCEWRLLSTVIGQIGFNSLGPWRKWTVADALAVNCDTVSFEPECSIAV